MGMDFQSASPAVMWEVVSGGRRWRAQTNGDSFIRSLQNGLRTRITGSTTTPWGTITPDGIAVDGAWGVATTKGLWALVPTYVNEADTPVVRASIERAWTESTASGNVAANLVATAAMLISMAHFPGGADELCIENDGYHPPRINTASPGVGGVVSIAWTDLGPATSCAPATATPPTPLPVTPLPGQDKGGATPPAPPPPALPDGKKTVVTSLAQAATAPLPLRPASTVPWGWIALGAAGLTAVVLAVVLTRPARAGRRQKAAA